MDRKRHPRDDRGKNDPCQKKQKSTEDSNRNFSSPHSLADEASPVKGFNGLDGLSIDCIFSFLDVKGLFRLAFCSRVLMDHVTHNHVIRSAVISGGHARTTMSEIVDLIKKQTIVVPSPLRLLRVTNGSTCERDTQCIHHQNNSTGKKVNFIRRGYGVFFCWECLSGSGTRKLGVKNPILRESRVLKQEYSSSAYVWYKPYTDSAGERAGAIVSFSEYDEWKKSGKTTENHLKLMDEVNPWSEKLDAIVSCYESSSQDLKRIVQENLEAKKKRQSTAFLKKLDKMKRLVHFLEASFENAPWKKYVLACKYADRASSSRDPCVRFNCTLLDNKMRPYAIAPSKGSNKKMKEVADKICHDFDLIWSKGFHDFSFLLNNSKAESFESGLRSFLQERFSPGDVLASRNMNEEALTLIKKEKLIEMGDRVWSLNEDLFATIYGVTIYAYANRWVQSNKG